MHFKTRCLLSTLLLAAPMHFPLTADDAQQKTKAAFTPFTGKVTRNKVRLRLQPNLDGQILRELSKDDLLVVVDEEDEFYAVAPPKGTKVYVYRTYVLDNTVEGNNVNVRLEPDTESPVIAQLNTGDKVEGGVSPLNSKWLEITPPPSARLFVCKEYMEKVGDASMISRMEKRREEVNSLLTATCLYIQSEMVKPFEEIDLDPIISSLNKVTKLYTDFPDQVARAKELLASVQDTYTQKRIAFLEAKAAALGHLPMQGTLSLQMRNQQEQLNRLEGTMESTPVAYSPITPERFEHPDAPESTDRQDKGPTVNWNLAFDPETKSDKMLEWMPAEKDLYQAWSQQNDTATLSNYYTQQINDALVIRGVIEPYHRSVKNKPGDYILISKGTNLPIAYLYSTQVNLQDHIGREITMKVSPRPNNHFAFPAYFVLAIE